MKLYQIKNRFNGETIYEKECNSFKECVEFAVKEGADLQGADLWGAYLTGANLHEAYLQGADLDFSCLPLWCGSLTMKCDDKQIKQILYHLLSIVQSSDTDLKESLLTDNLIEIANQFHRVGEVPKL